MSVTTEQIVEIITAAVAVDAIYLYGSRASGLIHSQSDWDIAVLYSDWESDKLEGALRPQMLEAVLQKSLDLYDLISVVDLERVPTALQINILRGKKLYDRRVLHVAKVENAIASKMELEYAQ